MVDERTHKILKNVEKFCLDRQINKDAIISDRLDVSDGDLIQVYEVFYDKIQNTVYKKRLSSQAAALVSGKKLFEELSKEDKCLVLNEILHLFQCRSRNANLVLIGGKKDAGKQEFRLSKNITKHENISIINQSATGFYEQVIDLKLL